MLVARYQVRLKDSSGTVVAIFDDWRSLQYQRKINNAGFINFAINGDDPRAMLLSIDGQIEILRTIPGYLDWYTDFDGIIEDYDDTLLPNGDHELTVIGSTLNSLLSRRVIAYRSGTAQADKSGVAETVMKEYVDENIGSSATSPPRVLSSGVMTGFSVESDAGSGATWNGQRSTKNLLDVLKEIANAGGVDFSVVRTGAATYEFRVYADQLGLDRTTTGMDAATGLNAAGNPPVIFAPELGNISQATYASNRRGKANAVYVFGQGTGAARQVAVSEDAVDIALSPIARRETARNGASQNNAGDLQQLADSYLIEFSPRASFTFTPLFTQQQLYGLHLDLGDRVTAQYRGMTFNKRITAVTISVTDKGEAPPKLEMADIP